MHGMPNNRERWGKDAENSLVPKIKARRAPPAGFSRCIKDRVKNASLQKGGKGSGLTGGDLLCRQNRIQFTGSCQVVRPDRYLRRVIKEGL